MKTPRFLTRLIRAVFRRPRSVCIFCGPTDEPITNEHLWSMWVAELFRLSPKGATWNALVRVRTGTRDSSEWRSQPVRRWKSRRIELTMKTVCRRCNNGWLSELENRFCKPVLSPMMMRGAGTTLSVEGAYPTGVMPNNRPQPTARALGAQSVSESAQAAGAKQPR